MLLWLAVIAGLVFVVASFGFQNVRDVTLDYFGAQVVGVPLWLVVAVPTAVGVLVGSLMAIPGRVRAAFARRRVAKAADARDRSSEALRLRVVELERDLALARVAPPVPMAVTVEQLRPPDVPDLLDGEPSAAQRDAA